MPNGTASSSVLKLIVVPSVGYCAQSLSQFYQPNNIDFIECQTR